MANHSSNSILPGASVVSCFEPVFILALKPKLLILRRDHCEVLCCISLGEFFVYQSRSLKLETLNRKTELIWKENK